jgi:hypothetical protein
MVMAQRDVREWAVSAKRASRSLGARAQLAMERAQQLSSASLALRAAAEAARTRSRQAKAPLRYLGLNAGRALAGFKIEGVVRGQHVRAHWSGSRLDCDEMLRDQALFLVDMGEELVYADPPRRLRATLEGQPVAVALTLMRACDRVVAFEFDLP